MFSFLSPYSLSTEVDRMFIYGSPLGLFFSMREHGDLVVKDHRSAASILPSSVFKRLHNVHHPSDPIVSCIIKVFSNITLLS